MAAVLTPAVAHLRAGVYTCAAGGTILLYDILLTTKDEIRLIWPSKFSLVKCLYLVNRYLPVPCLLLGMYHLANLRGPLSTNFCRLVILSQMAGQAMSLIAATWLLVLRVVALYSGNKLVTFALYFVFLSTHLTTIVLSAIIIQQLWGGLVYIELVGICAAYPSTHILGIVYFAPVICEFVLVAMQLFHAYQHTRRVNGSMRPTTPLLRTLYADGFAYFVVVVAFRLWTAFIFITADMSYWYISTYLEFALISTSVSRLVLHLRRTAEIHRHSHMPTTISIPLSQLTQSINAANITSHNNNNHNHNNHYNNHNNNNGNGNPYRNSNRHSKYNKQNRNSYQPQSPNRAHHVHDHHKKQPRKNHTTSSFQNAAETIYPYPSESPYARFSRARPLSGSGSGMGMGMGTDGSESWLTLPDSPGTGRNGRIGGGGGGGGGGTDGGWGGGWGGRRRYDHENHKCDLCCDDFDGGSDGLVGASSRRADDDHSYVELVPVIPLSAVTPATMETAKREGRTPPPPPPPPPPLSPPLSPPGIGEGDGYGDDVRMERSLDGRGSSRGIAIG